MNLVYFILIPISAALLTLLFANEKFEKVRITISMISALTLMVLSILLFEQTMDGGLIIYNLGGWKPPVGINLFADTLSAIFILLISFICLLSTIYSSSYIKSSYGYERDGMYYPLLLFLIAGMNGVILTGDLFNMFVFLEIAAISSYALVAFFGGGEELEASFKYAILGTIASFSFLVGVGLIYEMAGSLNLIDIEGPTIFLLFYLLFISAVFPLYIWLPDAHSASPAPISAILSGVFVNMGIYGIMRIESIESFGMAEPLFIVLGLITMITSSGLALVQRDLKRMLAYSTVSQSGYILMALGIGSLDGALFHIVNHAIIKSLLFFVSGCIIKKVGTRDMDRMGGLLGSMPLEGAAFLVGGLAISGVPPFNGFFSKLLIYMDCFKGGYYISFGIGLAISLLTLAYFLLAFQRIFLGSRRRSREGIEEMGEMGEEMVEIGEMEGRGGGWTEERTPKSILIPILILLICCFIPLPWSGLVSGGLR